MSKKIKGLLGGMRKSIVRLQHGLVSFFAKLYTCLKNPISWQSKPWNRRSIFVLSSILLLYLIIGSYLNSRYPFPKFYIFLGLFVSIFLITTLAEKRHSFILHEIRGLTIPDKGFNAANSIYSKLETSNIFLCTPLGVVLVFGVLGVAVFGAVQFSATLLWCLIFFSVVVYISIVGYIQYVALFIYIWKISGKEVIITNQVKAKIHSMPIEVDWLQKLTKLSHLYRTAFFTIGSLYIISFGVFCYHPAFETRNDHVFTYILWAIIFLAIVIVFPLISIIEYYLIKKIVKKVKQSYINDLIEEYDLCLVKSPQWVKKHATMLTNIFTVAVENTGDYPIPNRLSASYAFVIAILNLLGSIVTINDLTNLLVKLS